jgi:tyrosyl-tRNA synthetase
VRHNSEWYENMSLADLLSLSREATVAQFIDRDDFSQRHKNGIPISLVEFLYPLIQGYDSVMLRADVELGGNDQLFNMLVGRQLQKNRSMEEQAVMCMPLLIGLDGQRKMSKSFSNYIAFNDIPEDMFGKIMSISDETMWTYYRLLLEKCESEIVSMKNHHPMEMKKELAHQLVAVFYGKESAEHEEKHFTRIFSRNEMPECMHEIHLLDLLKKSEANLLDILAATGKFRGKNEIRQLKEQGAIRVNGEVIQSLDMQIHSHENAIIRVGKRIFFRIK